MLKNILVNFKLLALYSLYREKNHVYMGDLPILYSASVLR